jgi:hypothetical protein
VADAVVPGGLGGRAGLARIRAGTVMLEPSSVSTYCRWRQAEALVAADQPRPPLAATDG